MPKHNIRILTKAERDYFNKKYIFEIIDNKILVKVKDYNRITAHEISKNFSLNTKLRKLTISKEAIKLWSEKFYGKYSLIDVQNAINQLLITYQLPSEKEIEQQLNKNDDLKIKCI